MISARQLTPPLGHMLIAMVEKRSELIGSTAVSCDSHAIEHMRQPSISEHITTELTVNGHKHRITGKPWVTLLDLLRERLHLTGGKKGCDHGQCGACTVLVNGRRTNSCLKLAVSLDGAEIITIEGLADGERLHPLQQAFVQRDAFQCGYCTPGQICSAQGLIDEGHAQSREEIRELMSGNLCRCGAYTNIADAIEDVILVSRNSLREAAE